MLLLAAVSVEWEGGGNLGNMRLCVFDFDRAFSYVTRYERAKPKLETIEVSVELEVVGVKVIEGETFNGEQRSELHKLQN